MEKKNKIVLIIILAAILGLVGYITWQKDVSNKKNDQAIEDDAKIIFFYGTECPHCQLVEKYIEENQLDQKVDFSKREVYHNKSNATLMEKKAKECGIETKSLGVPFLWANGKCYVGENEVENLLNEEAKK